MDPLDYEYVVMGSGPRGGPLASRLALNGHEVLLIKAGDDRSFNINAQVPAFHLKSTEDDDMRWDYYVNLYVNQTRKSHQAEIKSFVFAGHDTSGITLTWALYGIWRTPRVLHATSIELDDLCVKGADLENAREKLRSPGGEELVSSMPYIAPVFREILRLCPPAGTARMAPLGTGFTVRTAAGDES